MPRMRCWLPWLCLVLVGLSASALAQVAPDGTQIRVLGTWPQGEVVRLAPNQNFYLHLAYDAPRPTGLWVQPMYHGKPARAGMSGSPMHTGKGEAVVWFFLMNPDVHVDEVRIQTGNGGPGDQPVVTVWRGHISGGGVATEQPNPAWLERLLPELATRAARAAEQPEYVPPRSAPGDVLLLVLFWLPGLVAPLATAWFLRGGWRIAMLVPAAGMAYVTLRFAVDVYRDATSHNLWPFELAIYTLASFACTAVLMVAWGIVKVRSNSRSA